MSSSNMSGLSGDDAIRSFQATLNRYSYKFAFAPIATDGVIGPRTAAATWKVLLNAPHTLIMFWRFAALAGSRPPNVEWVRANHVKLGQTLHTVAESQGYPSAARAEAVYAATYTPSPALPGASSDPAPSDAAGTGAPTNYLAPVESGGLKIAGVPWQYAAAIGLLAIGGMLWWRRKQGGR